MGRHFKVLIYSFLALFISLSVHAKVNPNDSLMVLLKNTTSDKNSIPILLQLSEGFQEIDIKKSEEFANQALQVSQVLQLYEKVTESYFRLSDICIHKKQYLLAEKHLQDALTNADSYAYKKGMLEAMNKKVALFVNHSNEYDKGFEAANRLESFSKKIENERYEGIGIKYQGYVQYVFGSHENARLLFHKAAVKLKNAGDTFHLIDVYTYLSENFIETKKYDSAYVYLNKTVSLHKKTKNKPSLKVYHLIGETFLLKQNYDSAFYYFTVSEKIAFNEENWRWQAYLNVKISHLFLTQKNFSFAIKYAEIGKEIAYKYTLRKEKTDVFDVLYKIYKANGDLKNATISLEKFVELKDSLINSETRVNIDNLQKHFMEEKYLEQLQQAKDEKDTVQTELNDNRDLLLLAISGASLLLILLGFLLWNLRRNRILNEKLQESNDSKSQLLKEVHHRVKNNLQLIHSLLNLQLYSVKDEKLKGVINEIKGRIGSMALVHDKLYKSDTSENVDLDKYLIELMSSIANAFKTNQKLIDVHINCKNIFISVEVSIPLGLIMNELLTNAYKYAYLGRERGNLWINVTQVENKYTIEVKDDGVGLPANFDVESSETLGMELVQLLSAQIRGTMTFTSKPNLGTSFVLVFNEYQEEEF